MGSVTNVIGSYRDQLGRIGGISDREVIRVNDFLADAGAAETLRQKRTAAAYGHYVADRLDPATQGDLIAAIRAVADDLDAQTR